MVTEKEKKLLEYMWEQKNNLEEFISRNGYPEDLMYEITITPDLKVSAASATAFYDNNHCKRTISKKSVLGEPSTIREREYEYERN